MRYLVLAMLLLSVPARAAELSLNDLPTVLYNLRGCSESRGFLNKAITSCRIPAEDLWASVGGDGQLTLFRKRSYGDTTYARGQTVNALLQDFAKRINDDQAANKAMLEALTPYLPTQ